jgi:hypothetical protein
MDFLIGSSCISSVGSAIVLSSGSLCPFMATVCVEASFFFVRFAGEAPPVAFEMAVDASEAVGATVDVA